MVAVAPTYSPSQLYLIRTHTCIVSPADSNGRWRSVFFGSRQYITSDTLANPSSFDRFALSHTQSHFSVFFFPCVSCFSVYSKLYPTPPTTPTINAIHHLYPLPTCRHVYLRPSPCLLTARAPRVSFSCHAPQIPVPNEPHTTTKSRPFRVFTTFQIAFGFTLGFVTLASARIFRSYTDTIFFSSFLSLVSLSLPRACLLCICMLYGPRTRSQPLKI